MGVYDLPWAPGVSPKYMPFLMPNAHRMTVGLMDVDPFGKSPLVDFNHVFDIDRFWPHYMRQKQFLMSNYRSSVYQDINKKKLIKTHRELSMMVWFELIDDLVHGHPKTINGSLNLNPNWDDWHIINSLGYEDPDLVFQKISSRNHIDYPTYQYRNYYGEPLINFVIGEDVKRGLEHLSNMVQEDLCILRRRKDDWNLRAASVCFPSGWKLEDKIGKPLHEIHEPVPEMTRDISEVITQKLDLIEPMVPVQRFNWTLKKDCRLHQPTIISSINNTIEEPGKVFIRVERQVFTKLNSGDILFTIRTYVNTLLSIVFDSFSNKDPRKMVALSDAIRKTDLKTWEYRGFSSADVDLVCRYLDTNAQACH